MPLCAAVKHRHNSCYLALTHAFACNAPNFRASYRARLLMLAEQQYFCVCFVGRIDCCSRSLFLRSVPAIDDDCNGGHEKFYTTFLINGKTTAPFACTCLFSLIVTHFNCSCNFLHTFLLPLTLCLYLSVIYDFLFAFLNVGTATGTWKQTHADRDRQRLTLSPRLSAISGLVFVNFEALHEFSDVTCSISVAALFLNAVHKYYCFYHSVFLQILP